MALSIGLIVLTAVLVLLVFGIFKWHPKVITFHTLFLWGSFLYWYKTVFLLDNCMDCSSGYALWLMLFTLILLTLATGISWARFRWQILRKEQNT